MQARAYRKTKKWLAMASMAWAVAVLGVFQGTVQAAGLLIADGGLGGQLKITEHAVDVTINNGVAVTRVTQVFQNQENRQVEALYTFPVPEGASVANFSMWIGGKEVIGEVLEKKRAREIYDSYKRVRRDPGLLEQKDYKTFEMRIFPIGPKAEQRIELTYYQELRVDHDWATYVYPLATSTREDAASAVEGRFAINFEVKSAVPIAKIESASHGDGFVMAQHSDAYVQASLEDRTGSLAKDVVLAYNLSRPRTGLDMITSKEPGEDGYFQLSVTLGEDLKALDEGMDYVFVLDSSGSMGHEGKLANSRGLVDAFVQELGDKDRFEIITFNVQPNTLFNQLEAVTEAAQTRATDYLNTREARGGTNLKPALETAYRYGDADRFLNVVVLSDGLTDQAERTILMQQIQSRPSNARVFCVGLGNDVNRPLLEQLAERSGGLAAFVSRGENYERQAQAFRRKLLRPAATDVAINFDGRDVYDITPGRIPNIYHGSPVRIYGRYKGSGAVGCTLKATCLGRPLEQTIQVEFPGEDNGNPEIERMWAWHTIDQLLKQADAAGSRTPVLDEVIQLGETYSVVTEYTSFLVLENDAEYKRWKIDRKNRTRISRDRSALTDRKEQLELIRSRAMKELGPVEVKKEPIKMASRKPTSRGPGNVPPPQSQNRSWDLGVGSGPVGPLMLVMSGLLAWVRKRK